MGAVPLGWGIVGLLLAVLTWMCWTGRWRAWAESPLAGARPLLIAMALGLAIMAMSYPLLFLLPSPLGGVAFGGGWLAAVAGIILGFWSPQWFGPHWFREFRRAFYGSAWNSRYWMAEDWRRPGESSVDATQRHVSSKRPQPPVTLFARLYADPHGLLDGKPWRRGVLLYYAQAPAAWFTGTPANQERPREEIIPAEAMVGVQKLPPGTTVDGSRVRSGLRSFVVPRVRIDTTEGPWLFEVPGAKRAVKELRRRYLDRPAGPEPSWLLGEQPAEQNQLQESR